VYAIWQVELCPTTHRLHCQAYIRYSNAVALSRVIKLLRGQGHMEPCKGDEASNIAYCSKALTKIAGPWSFGEPAAPGKRKDIDVVRDLVSEGKGMREVLDVCSSYQSAKMAELILKYKEKGRNWHPEVRWYHGSTGGGKTRAAVEEFPDAWMSMKDGAWFEGYDAHEVTIFDDFRKDFCSFATLLRLLDRYPYRVQFKGGSRQLLARVMIITCPWAPDVLYDNRSAEDIGQLIRRISVIKLFGDVVPPPGHANVSGNSVSVAHFRRP